MSLAGPRLDRPSAIGDEGRARGVSLWLATVAVVAVTVAGGVALGDPALVTGLAPVVGLLVAGIALLERSRFGQLVVGHALAFGFGSAVGLLVVASPFLGREAVAVAGFALALLGIAMAWADVDPAALERAGLSCGLTYATLVVGSVVAVLVGVVLVVTVNLLVAIVATDSAAGSLAGLLTVVVAVAVAGLFAVAVAPIRQLTRRSRRDAVDRQLASVRRTLGGVVLGGLGSLFVLGFLWLAGLFGALVAQVPQLERPLVALSTGAVVWPLVSIAVGLVVVPLLIWTVRAVTRRDAGDARSRIWTAAVTVAVAILLAGAVAVGLAALGVAIGNLASGGAILALAGGGAVLVGVGPLAYLLLVGTILVAVWLAFLPDRAIAPALAGTGLVVAAAALGSHAPFVAIGCVGVACFVWDTGTYGLELTAELGHQPRTRRLELVHGLLSLAVAVGAVALVAGLAGLVSGLGAAIASPVALVVAAVGAIVLLIPIRG
ncbi:DUF7519 family protein [Natrarchaeobaculum aegyptiacum]|uniref:Uncharacterized protein n=1 Tax=Natrarchaeobaculum aegyptiacum TaxID=745377 RepID=A0A2Z2HQF8_9EURY|nr:hypothetical protein [Natrarchaeobaculum aegyptiacum]ARS89269.1 hypothetical protein B1756_05590 [Natrarchaeobaculum aegyptiacum]